jgi:benzoyl-CoA reductase/2-hydroxyglutaryl-CoA dehydratase subunit BcrC/BadD/HgdB
MNPIKELYSISKKTHNSYLDGKKTMGYFCSYVPEEIIHAAGFVPYRMRSVESPGSEWGDVYFSSMNCSYVRHCMSKAIKGDFNFLSGVIFMNGCDHNRRLYDNWRQAEIKHDFIHFIAVPHTSHDVGTERYKSLLKKMMDDISAHFKISISDEKLTASIRLYNEKRTLLAKLNQMRKEPAPPISGAEFHAVMLALSAIPVEEAIAFLKKILEFAGNQPGKSNSSVRIMLVGNCLDEIPHLELIEQAGAVIVADKICLGSTYSQRLIDENIEPLDAIGTHYLNQITCPRMLDKLKDRISYINKTIVNYSVEAIIFDKLKFCTLFSSDATIFQKEAKKTGIPSLVVERELYGQSSGQLMTRLQAFFEQIRHAKTKREKA